MRHSFLIILFFNIICNTIIHANEQTPNPITAKHNIKAEIKVADSWLAVTDTIEIPYNAISEDNSIVFYLNKNLTIDSCNFNTQLISANNGTSTYNTYVVKNINHSNSIIVIKYKGCIDDQKQSLLHPQGMPTTTTKGIIFEKGIYLSGSSYWVPRFENVQLTTFDLSVAIDKTDWTLITQGDEISHNKGNSGQNFTFSSKKPNNQIYLIGNKWNKSSIQHGSVILNAYLLNKDEELANKYLSSTTRYMSMYENMLGAYPYSKFDLIENFWESGLGMPSFTLLGSRVIRMPWILYSSYPHELLHNYWGNSVFPDYKTGNWTEGITTYMADYFFKEQKGEDKEYRRNALQNFSNYVNEDNDFPVSSFKARTDKSSSAIGYDKVVMINHMLRTKYGKETFLKAYKDFYSTNKFTVASFSDIQKSFEKITGDNLSNFFTQWVQKKGAPQIKISNVSCKKAKGKYKTHFTISQVQNEDAFEITIPINLTSKTENLIADEQIFLSKKKQDFSITTDFKPSQLACDPNFVIMRRLDQDEIPSTLSGLMGAKELTIVLPSIDKKLQEYETFANAFKRMQTRSGNKVTIITDSEYKDESNNAHLWILGNNLLSKKAILPSKYEASLSSDQQNIFKETINTGTIFYTFKDNNKNIAFLKTNASGSLMQILMKMRHYGSNSYLGFESNSNKNILNGVFPVFDTPLSIKL